MTVYRVQNNEDLALYQGLTERWLGIRYPTEYLEKASVFLAKDECGEILGGYCIQSNSPFRVIESLPENTYPLEVQKPVELTGLWFRPNHNKPKGRLRFWFALCCSFFRYIGRDVVFAYSSSKPGLARSYASGKPKILFSGVTKIQPGMTEPESEVVCVVPGYRIALLPFMRPQFYWKRLIPRRHCVS